MFPTLTSTSTSTVELTLGIHSSLCSSIFKKKQLTKEWSCTIIVGYENDPLAQMAEHMTFNHGVRSSTLRWVTKRNKSEPVSIYETVRICFFYHLQNDIPCLPNLQKSQEPTCGKSYAFAVLLVSMDPATARSF